MKIARPSKPEVPFKRKRSPPPQATKLLRYSLLSGVVFMILLAIVFLPRMFPSQPRLATKVELVLAADPTNSSRVRIEVSSVGAMVNLTRFQAVFSHDATTVASLGPPLFSGGNPTFSFTDANGDGLLGPGDYFSLTLSPAGCSRVSISQLDSGSTFLVGQYVSGGCPPP